MREFYELDACGQTGLVAQMTRFLEQGNSTTKRRGDAAVLVTFSLVFRAAVFGLRILRWRGQSNALLRPIPGQPNVFMQRDLV